MHGVHKKKNTSKPSRYGGQSFVFSLTYSSNQREAFIWRFSLQPDVQREDGAIYALYYRIILD